MANIGILVVGMRANYSELERDLSKGKKAIQGFAGGAGGKPILGDLVGGGAAENFRQIDSIGNTLKRLFRNVGAGPFAEIADGIGDAAGAAGAFGAVAGFAMVGVTIAIGAVVAGLVTLKGAATAAMKAVDAAFKLKDSGKTIEALNKIIEAGAGGGISITLFDTQKVQAVNEALEKFHETFAAFGVQLVSDFQPEILGLIAGMREVVRQMSVAAKASYEFGKHVAEKTGLNTAVGRGVSAGLLNAAITNLFGIPGAGNVIVGAAYEAANAAKLPEGTNYMPPAALQADTVAQFSASRQAIMDQLGATDSEKEAAKATAEATKKTAESTFETKVLLATLIALVRNNGGVLVGI